MRVITCLLLLTFAGCGIKAPPRPPLDEGKPEPVSAADAGCCREAK